MKTTKFTTGCLYHVYNRGADARNIFGHDKDYLRFIYSLYEFNDKRFALPHRRIFRGGQILKEMPCRPLVNILCFCLMPNHFHLILQQIADDGITKFMRKLGTGYTMYFNLKNERQGVLFQGKFKAIIVETDEYLLHLSRYVHLNSVELVEPNWKQVGINNWHNVKRFLEEYRWSSLPDYMNVKNFPFLTQREFILKYFKDRAYYKKFTEGFLIKDFDKIREITLD